MCFQFTHFPCDEWENIYTLSYYYHQIGSINYYSLFRVRSWNNGMRCVSFYIRIDFEVGFYPRMKFFIASIFRFNCFLNNVYRTQHSHHYRAPDILFDLWSCNNPLCIIWSWLFGCKSKHKYKYSIFQNQGTPYYLSAASSCLALPGLALSGFLVILPYHNCSINMSIHFKFCTHMIFVKDIVQTNYN